ncbi:UNKNOWN [Stylonychia lemnae]|uniref:Transmembrane protein n=1 Tax=Stylonychia lemnae TaxID=5949 RepID=A0A078B755_STYLE|nr:UNKNOWN [Stylonychia lemnae]|eukprot:CDW90345.1 UNKNOWN [Stylonychia lemnae]
MLNHKIGKTLQNSKVIQSYLFTLIVKQFKKAKPFCRKAGKSFKQLDMYGKQVSLTYKGQETYKSLIGAAASAIVYGVVFAFFFYRLATLITKGDTKVAKKSFYKDLDSGASQSYNIGQMGFDFAFQLTGEYNQSIAQLEANQVIVSYNESTQKSNRIKLPLQIIDCGIENFRFKDQSKVSLYNINNFKCIKGKDYQIQGNYYSKDFKYVEIKTKRCKYENENNNCSEKSSIDTFFRNNQLNFAFINSFFDFNNYSQPIQTFIDDALEFFDDLAATDDTLAAIYIRVDKAYDIYERAIYGISDLLGDIGGFKESIIMLGLFMIFQKSISKQGKSISYKDQKKAFRQQKLQQKKEYDNKAQKFNQETSKIETQDKENLIAEVFSRQRFNYTCRDIGNYILRCGCLRSPKKMIMDPKMKKHVIFSKGTNKLMNELDCITLLKSLRMMKLITQVFLNQNQKLILRFQRKNVIGSDSSSSDSDQNDQDNLRLLESKNIIIKSTIKNKIKTAVEQYASLEEFKEIDKRILRGIFQRKLRDQTKEQKAIENIKKIFGKMGSSKNLNDIEKAPSTQIIEKNTWEHSNKLIKKPESSLQIMLANAFLQKQQTRTTEIFSTQNQSQYDTPNMTQDDQKFLKSRNFSLKRDPSPNFIGTSLMERESSYYNVKYEFEPDDKDDKNKKEEFDHNTFVENIRSNTSQLDQVNTSFDLNQFEDQIIKEEEESYKKQMLSIQKNENQQLKLKFSQKNKISHQY